MSDETPATPVATEPMSGPEFLEAARKAKAHIRSLGKSLGPCYSSGGNTSLWYDQVFGADIEPDDTQALPVPLRVGSHSGGLYAALNVMPDAAAPCEFAEGSTVTFTFKMARDEAGPYSAVGPTICMKAPAGGLAVEPGDTVFRVALPDFPEPYVMVELEFSGTISGANLVCGLGLAAR